MTPGEADVVASSAAVYVHVPFCATVCPYCDFAVVAGQDDLADRYIDAVVAEIGSADSWRSLEAVYFGGGTPSHISPALLGTVLEALDAKHGIATDAEISLEANPEDFSESRAHQLAGIGFNRVSFGAQSFDNDVLVSLGRRHTAGQIVASTRAARHAGFDNMSLDLIYGTPGESDESWKQTLRQATEQKPEHISCYALTVERGTPLGRAVLAGAQAPDPDAQADRFEAADELLADRGYHRYEVSNWARRGSECRYNLIVWAQGEYEGYGNGAHGFRGGSRYRNHRRLEAYITTVESGVAPRAGADDVVGWDAELDRLFVGLRRVVGVAEGPGVMAYLRSEGGLRLAAAGVTILEEGRLRIARPLLTDEVLRTVLGLQPPEGWAEPEAGDNVLSETHA